jgi:hypothetical protein
MLTAHRACRTVRATPEKECYQAMPKAAANCSDLRIRKTKWGELLRNTSHRHNEVTGPVLVYLHLSFTVRVASWPDWITHGMWQLDYKPVTHAMRRQPLYSLNLSNHKLVPSFAPNIITGALGSWRWLLHAGCSPRVAFPNTRSSTLFVSVRKLLSHPSCGK